MLAVLPVLLSPAQLNSLQPLDRTAPIVFNIDAPAYLTKPVAPSYDEQVLKPLREAQAVEAARQTALEAARAAEVARVAKEAAQAAETVQTASPQSYGEPADGYKAFIYDHESGNDPTKYNSSGCLGLGQACPGSKLLAVCPSMSYACEDAYFTAYMQDKYGSWRAAYEFWIRTDCRPYCGNWW